MYCAYKHRGNEGMQVLTLTHQVVPSWDHIIYAITYKYLHFMNEVFQTSPPAAPPHAVLGWSSGKEWSQINAYTGCFYKRPDCRGKKWVLVTLSWGDCGRDRGKASCLWKTSFNSQDRQVHWKKNGEKIPSWGQTWSWLQGWVWFSLVFWHQFFSTQFSLGRPCKLFPRTPQWGSCGEFAAHGVQLVTELTWHFYSLRRIRMC